MKKLVTGTILMLCLGLALLSAEAAEPGYDTVVTVTGGTVESLQTAMDDLPADAGDVRIDLERTLFSYVNELDLSVPTDKGITSLTLSGAPSATAPVCVYTRGDGENTMRFFANGIPITIDDGVHFGPLPTTWPQGAAQLFGGSKNADLTGNTDITVNAGGAANAAIYGGGLNGRVDGDVSITVHGAYGTIHGGGLVSAAADSGDLCADVTGKVAIVVDSEVVPEYEAYRTHTWYNSHIYGGGRVATGFSDFTGARAFSAQVGRGVSIEVNTLMNQATIFGGGQVASQCTGGDVTLNADVTGNVDIRIGGRTQLIEDCVAPRSPLSVVGGGYVWRQNSSCSDRATARVHGAVTVTAVDNDAAAVGAGGINSIIGGGVTENGGANSDVTVNGDVTIETSRKTLPFKAVGGVYHNVGVAGGGFSSGGTANVTGNVDIHIRKAPGQNADYANVKNIVGGGVTNGAGTANVNGGVTVRIDDGIRLDGTPIEGIDRMGVIGGGWVRVANGIANVGGPVKLTVGAGATFSGTYRVSGGGWVTGDSGCAAVGGPVTVDIGENAAFDGEYMLLGGSGITGCWYGRAAVTGPVTTTVGPGAVFNGNYQILGGGWGGDYDNDATVHGDVTTAIGPGAAFNGAYRIVGGGWAGGGSYGGVAHVDGNVETRIGANAGFAGGYLPGRDGEADAKVGIVGGGWVTKSYEGTAGANVTGTVTTLIGENAAFQSPCRIVGGGAEDSGITKTAKTGPITLTLNGTAAGGDLEELFLGSLEGRSASASAVVTLKDARVGYLYDKDGYCPEPMTVHFLGSSQVGWAFLQGHGNGDEASAKAYRLNVGDGEAPAELAVTGYLTYGYAMPWERVDIRVFDGATLKSGSESYLFYYYMHSLTLDKGGALALYDTEGLTSSLTGSGGTLELMNTGARLEMTNSAAAFTGTVNVKVADPAAGQVVATTVRAGTQGLFVYAGDDFYIQRRAAGENGENYDWYLAALTPPTAATGLVYTGRPQPLLTTAGSGQDGVMTYSLDGETYFNDIADVAATDAGNYTVYYKVEGGADGVDVPPRSVEVTIAKAQNAITDLSCPDVPYGQTPNPTATALGEIDYTYSRDPDGPFGEWNTANAYGAWYVKAAVAGTDNYDGAEAVLEFRVTALPQDAPNITVDFAAETLTGFVPGGRYTVGGAEAFPENGALPVGPYLGQDLAIVKLGDGVSTADSPAQSLTVPARPGVPEGVEAVDETVLGKGDGKLTGLTAAMEYSPDGQAPWTQCPDGELPWAVGADVYARVKATQTAFAGEALPLRVAAGKPLTVTFETGADAAPDPVELAYNAALTPPEEPARPGFAFGGWFRDGEYTQPWDFENDRVTESLTLHAQWIALHTHVWAPTWDGDDDAHWHPCTASGCDLAEPIQMDGYGPHSPDAGTVTTHATPDAPGERTFRCATCQRVLRTEPIPQLSAAGSNVVVTPGAPGITVDQPRLDAVAEAERPTGGNVTVTLTVCLADDPRYQDAVAAIRTLAGEQSVDYMDLTLTKETVDADGNTETASITDTNGRVLEIAVDFDFAGKENVTVYRHHDGGAETLAENDTKADGTFRLEPTERKVYIYASKFSVYAIGYTLIPDDASTSPGRVTYCSILASATEGGTVSPAGRTRVRRGRSATVTITPEEGYVVADVLVDRKSVGAVREYTFEKITTGHSIQAVFTRQTACPKDVTCPIHLFTDAKPAAWYHDGVHFCLERGLMQGYGGGLFGPGDTLTRAQLAQILYNQAGKPAASARAPFDDVSPDAWYAPAVAWAAETGIVQGYGDGSFGPADPITREQLAAMLHRRAETQGKPLRGALSADFPDKDAVSPWAKEAMGAMTANGVIQGKENKRLDPQGPATRAESATMLQRFCQLTDK